MNVYEKRKAYRKLLRQIKSDDVRARKALECLNCAKGYENAYFALYGQRCDVRYANGWYWVHKRRYNRDQLVAMTERLEVIWHNQQYPAPVD